MMKYRIDIMGRTVTMAMLALFVSCGQQPVAPTEEIAPSDELGAENGYIAGIKTGEQMFTMMITALDVDRSTVKTIYDQVALNLPLDNRALDDAGVTATAYRLAFGVCNRASLDSRGVFGKFASGGAGLNFGNILLLANELAYLSGDPKLSEEARILYLDLAKKVYDDPTLPDMNRRADAAAVAVCSVGMSGAALKQ